MNKQYNNVKESLKMMNVGESFFKVDLLNQTIAVLEQVTLNKLYSGLQDLFDEPEYLQFSVPMSAQTPQQYTLINGWDIPDLDSKKNLTYGSIQSSSNKFNGGVWGSIHTTGGDFGQLFYSLDGGPMQEFSRPGPANELVYFPHGTRKIEIYGDCDQYGPLIYASSEYVDWNGGYGRTVLPLGLVPDTDFWISRMGQG